MKSAPVANTYDDPPLGAELIRALRGKRSQTALSRRLGYKTNVVYLWEARKGAPTGAGFLQLAQRVGVDVRHALTQFYRKSPPWLAEHEATSVSGVAALLDDLRGSSTLVETAAKLRVLRWRAGCAVRQSRACPTSSS